MSVSDTLIIYQLFYELFKNYYLINSYLRVCYTSFQYRNGSCCIIYILVSLLSNLGLESIALPLALIPLITNSIYRYNEIYNNPYDHEAEMEALYQSRINYDYIPVGGCRIENEYIENRGTINYRKCKQSDGSWK